MKERGKGFIAGVVASAVFVGLIGTAAATVGSRTVTADYNNIKISLNGSQITPKDATGATVEPFAINGTTYLPVRAVANALGISVGWDGETNTVTLSGGEGGANLDYVMKLGFYKKLAEGFEELQSDLDGILNGSAELVINTTIKEGPYTGMTFANAAQARLANTAELIDSHYDICFSNLNTGDIIVAADYTILNGKVSSMFKGLSTGTQPYTRNEIMQTYYDAMSYATEVNLMFWQTYQQAFN